MSHAAAQFQPQLAPFALSVNGLPLSHQIGMRTVLPSEHVSVQLADGSNITLMHKDKILASGKGKLRWRTPNKPGFFSLTIIKAEGQGSVTLQLFVLRPASEVVDGRLNNFRIGTYPAPLKGLKSYVAPRGFIEVEREFEQLQVSPHFTLGQFLSKQQSGYPKYVVLRPQLLSKLEFLLAEVNQMGILTDSFVIMSGYRTPFYNHAIKNVSSSRHIYGGAADIYIDVQPRDGVMDDLNGDGKTDLKDATVLYDIADSYVKRTGKTELTGGVGLYKSNAVRGPFVHIDVRGTRARW